MWLFVTINACRRHHDVALFYRYGLTSGESNAVMCVSSGNVPACNTTIGQWRRNGIDSSRVCVVTALMSINTSNSSSSISDSGDDSDDGDIQYV